MTRAQIKEQADASLEIISIGSLYSGLWDKKYWSSSRGKDRYPYPVGYQAIRAYNGIKYKMEIHEGPKGPLFMILSMDGGSFSGQTPDIAWEKFQRKGCLHNKIWHGKRSSCKVDGVEFFGLKNPFIQRLLRELVANISGTAEVNLLPSNLCNNASGSAQTKVEHHSADECEKAELIPCPERSKIIRKRSRNHGIEIAKSPGGAKLKKVRNHCPKIKSMTAKLSSSVSVNEENQSFCGKYEKEQIKGISLTVPKNDDISNRPTTFLAAVPASAIEKAMREDGISATTEVAHNLPNDEKLHDRLSMDKLEGINREMETDDNSGVASFQKDCPDTEDDHHHASDTSDLKQDSLGKNNLNQPDIVVPEELVMDSHPEEICSLNINSGSERNDFDSVGQDMVKSMMTFLLPQAIPLLKKTSGRKKASTSTLESLPCDGNTKDILPMEKEDREKQEHMVTQHGDYQSTVPSLELSRPSLHNLEGEQHYDHVDINGSFSSIADDGRAKEDLKPINSCGFELSGRMNDESLVNHHETTGSKKSCDSEIGENLHGTCQEGNLYVPECLPSWTSSGIALFDETMHNNIRMEECPLNLQINSGKVDLRTPKDYVESNGDEQPCLSVSFSQLHAQNAYDSSTSSFSEALNKEVLAGKKAAGIDTLPSSQVPSIVYSRRKAQNVSHLTKEHNSPPNEAYRTNCLGKHFGAEISSTRSPHSSDTKINILPRNQQREDFLSEPTPGEQSPINCSYKITMKSEAGLEKICSLSPTLDQEEASLRARANMNDHNSELLGKPVWKEDLEGCVDEEMIEHNNVFSTNKYELSHDMGATFRHNNKDSYPHCNVELYREAEGMSKIVGSYLHPMPVLSVFLINVENLIHICVLCGLPVDKNRTLMTYTVEMGEPRLGYPSLVGHTTVTLPTLNDYLGKEIAVERTGFQLTPDGKYIVLIGGVRTPFCRTGNINCSCSTCTSGKFEENVVNIVQVKYGYVSIMASLKSADCAHCILVCEPDQLVAVGRGGRLHLWVMDSTWGKQIESHTIPSGDHISPNLVDLKRIPKFANLVVGHNGVGEFSLWGLC
ncbi:uncharacterized protein LOC111018735 isoform X2 [Momordica charantia]|uniref:Uncharacterized protein LOC111018735 isoform X2 n=1 Tax=Momordica charantia TaxID=3673 RepID=A0A6J1DA01_MOMCH|nr:uncharacterized protein LOC111018735 isoform X2 [Momordica charantia]